MENNYWLDQPEDAEDEEYEPDAMTLAKAQKEQEIIDRIEENGN